MQSRPAPNAEMKQCPLIGRLVTPQEVAAYLGITVRTLSRWTAAGEFPGPLKVGRSVRFVGAEIALWVDGQIKSREPMEVHRGDVG